MTIRCIKEVDKSFEMQPPRDDNEQIKITRRHLEGYTLEWFIWFEKQNKGLSINWLVFLNHIKKCSRN